MFEYFLSKCKKTERPQNFGFKVEVKFKPSSPFQKTTSVYRNVTEIHYNYRNGMFENAPASLREIMLAIESNIHGMGFTYSMETDVEEFVVQPETEIASHF